MNWRKAFLLIFAYFSIGVAYAADFTKEQLKNQWESAASAAEYMQVGFNYLGKGGMNFIVTFIAVTAVLYIGFGFVENIGHAGEGVKAGSTVFAVAAGLAAAYWTFTNDVYLMDIIGGYGIFLFAIVAVLWLVKTLSGASSGEVTSTSIGAGLLLLSILMITLFGQSDWAGTAIVLGIFMFFGGIILLIWGIYRKYKSWKGGGAEDEGAPTPEPSGEPGSPEGAPAEPEAKKTQKTTQDVEQQVAEGEKGLEQAQNATETVQRYEAREPAQVREETQQLAAAQEQVKTNLPATEKILRSYRKAIGGLLKKRLKKVEELEKATEGVKKAKNSINNARKLIEKEMPHLRRFVKYMPGTTSRKIYSKANELNKRLTKLETNQQFIPYLEKFTANIDSWKSYIRKLLFVPRPELDKAIQSIKRNDPNAVNQAISTLMDIENRMLKFDKYIRNSNTQFLEAIKSVKDEVREVRKEAKELGNLEGWGVRVARKAKKKAKSAAQKTKAAGGKAVKGGKWFGGKTKAAGGWAKNKLRRKKGLR